MKREDDGGARLPGLALISRLEKSFEMIFHAPAATSLKYFDGRPFAHEVLLWE